MLWLGGKFPTKLTEELNQLQILMGKQVRGLIRL